MTLINARWLSGTVGGQEARDSGVYNGPRLTFCNVGKASRSSSINGALLRLSCMEMCLLRWLPHLRTEHLEGAVEGRGLSMPFLSQPCALHTQTAGTDQVHWLLLLGWVATFVEFSHRGAFICKDYMSPLEILFGSLSNPSGL